MSFFDSYYNTPEKGLSTLIPDLAGRKRLAKIVITPNDLKKSKIKTDAEEGLEELQRIAKSRRRVRAEGLEETKKRDRLDSVSDV